MFLRTLKSRKDHSHTMCIKQLFLTSRGTKAAGPLRFGCTLHNSPALFQLVAPFLFPKKTPLPQTAVSLCAQHLAQCVVRSAWATPCSMKGQNTAMEAQ